MEKKPSYYRARIELIEKLIEANPDDRQKVNSDSTLLKNGVIPATVLKGKTEQQCVSDLLKKGNYSDAPLMLDEKCKWNTWFAMHPEKQAGIELVTSSIHFPVTIKGSEQDIINTLTPVGATDKQKRIRIAKAKARAKQKILKLTTV